jgi:neopullulanase
MKLAFGLMLTLRGIPEIYYGDEIGMPGGGDPDNRRDFPGGWKEDSANAFTAEGRSRDQQEIFSYAQNLLRLRREHDALRTGRLWHLFSDETSYAFLRESEEEILVVAFNNSSQQRSIETSLRDTPIQKVSAVKMLFGDAHSEVRNGALHITMPAQSLSIIAAE